MLKAKLLSLFQRQESLTRTMPMLKLKPVHTRRNLSQSIVSGFTLEAGNEARQMMMISIEGCNKLIGLNRNSGLV
jgi:hypothetical protein